MKKLVFISLFVLLMSSFVFAQTNEAKNQKKCPTIAVASPPSAVLPGEIMTFSLEIDGEYDEEKLKIKWSVDGGTIVQGQGTKILSVINTEGKDETITVTANVNIGEGCQLSASETGITVVCALPRLFDEFGNINAEDIWSRIDSYLAELQNNPGSEGYIVNYGSERKIKLRKELIKYYLKNRKADLSKLVFANGGKEKEIRTRFWIVPNGADASVID